MTESSSIRDVQLKILEIMLFIDKVCRENNISYYIMGGTALGAIRHGGFIPWDDDLDIFMEPQQYEKFKEVFSHVNSDDFVLQEWKTSKHYVEYSKVRMNGTTFIEENYKDCKEMHHGIYVDIMILHKVPNNKLLQRIVYYQSKFVTLYALSKRNWKPKNNVQKIALHILKILPCQLMVEASYRHIYKYDEVESNFKYCYWITPAKFHAGLFDSVFFQNAQEIQFEGFKLLGPTNIEKYLEYRYGDYMQLPPEHVQKNSIHAMIYDTQQDYKVYLEA